MTTTEIRACAGMAKWLPSGKLPRIRGFCSHFTLASARKSESSKPEMETMRTLSGIILDCNSQGIHFCKGWKPGFGKKTPWQYIMHGESNKNKRDSSKWNVSYFYHHFPSLGDAIATSSHRTNIHESADVVHQSRTQEPSPSQASEYNILMAHYIPVYVMLPLDTISNDNKLVNVELLSASLEALRAAHVDGLMIDVWWGIVEGAGPKEYDWSAYRSLFELIQTYGFKLQTIMSFHQCGRHGDSCFIQLPQWVLKEGESNPEIFFTNRDLKRNKEYLSFGVDDERVLQGRTAVEVYTDFMQSFRENMHDFLESGMITEIDVGLGPAGELRYPSFTGTHGWRFPGIGEFQCYDKYLLSSLKKAAENIGQNEWGYSGPKDAGSYNDWPDQSGFFRPHGSFATDYGRFFLEWYSDILLKHGDKILEVASHVFEGYKVKLAAKIAGIHWWYKTRSHAAELAAGYYNLRERDGYKPIAKMLARHRATLNFTCIEMRDAEHYWEARCGPEGLVRQVLNAGWNEGIQVSCENALPRFDHAAFDQILQNARPDGINRDAPPERRVFSFTYLRLSQELMQENHWREFTSFVRKMHADLDYHPEPEKYFYPRVPLERSKPLIAFSDDQSVPVASVPLDHYHVPLAPKKEKEPFFSRDAPGGGLGTQVENASHSFPMNLIAWLWKGINKPMREPNQEAPLISPNVQIKKDDSTFSSE